MKELMKVFSARDHCLLCRLSLAQATNRFLFSVYQLVYFNSFLPKKTIGEGDTSRRCLAEKMGMK